MVQQFMRKLPGLCRAWIVIGTLIMSAMSFAQAQSSSRSPVAPPPSSPPTNTNNDHDNDVDFGSRETDARARLILKAEKKAYEEHVARAKEANELAGELKTSYAASNTFNAADEKKLERLEKLTRRIRNDVGGSEMDA